MNALDAYARSLLAQGKTGAAREVFAEALGLAQTLGNETEVQFAALELDRLNDNLASARERLNWFEKRGLLNGVTLTRRYFPSLTEAKAAEPVKARPRLEVLGPVQLSFEGKIHIIRGRKRKALLALLLEHRLAGRGEASALELCDALYSEGETDAQRSLKQLVFQVRAALGQDLITTTPNGYALGQARSDAELFLETGDTALWRGVYLEDLDSRDEAVSGALYLALKARLSTLLTENPAEAARVGRLLLAAEPYDLGAFTLALQALQQAGDAKGLGHLYKQGRAHFAEVGETLPESWQGFLGRAPEDAHL